MAQNEETEDVYEELDPSKVARDMMDYLIHDCGADELECMPLPDEEDAIYRALAVCDSTECVVARDAFDESKTFRDELEKEFREMLNDYWAHMIALQLVDVLNEAYNEIVNNEDLVDFRKAKLLKKYQKVLEEFVDAIDRALKEKKPLSKKDLYNWFMDIGETVLGTEAYDWFDLRVDYMLGDFYDSLNDYYKLVMLWNLEDDIRYNVNSLLHKIERKIPELEGLANIQ